MVYEAREGQTFVLGASTWRIESITRDRVLVSPAPGLPGIAPFWKGEGVGRPFELGERIGRATRELVALSDDAARDRLQNDYDLERRAAANLVAFLRDQEGSTGVVPSDRAIVVERFRDEIGDWRVCVLTPFGGRVHAPWAMALAARLRDNLGIDAQSLWSDDGIALHFPDSDVPPPVSDLLVDPDELEDLVVAELAQSALFGARFRENASRALLIPRRRPGQRTPLWQQRLKAQNLLQVARRYPQFPIVLETYRECLQDVFDLAVAPSHPARRPDARARSRRGGDGFGIAVRGVAALRLRRDLHVRGRHAACRAPCAGALARSRPAARAHGRRGAPRPAGRRCDRAGRGVPRAAAAERRRAPRPAAARRSPAARRGRPWLRGDARPRAPRDPRAARRRRGPARLGGRGALPGRLRRRSSRRAAGRVPGARCRSPCRRSRPLREDARPVHDRGDRRALRPRARARRAGAAAARGGGAADTRRAPSGRHGARVVRPGRAAPHPARDARHPAARGRAGRAGRPRSLPALLARHRASPDAARGARPAAGAAAAGAALGVRGAAAGASRPIAPPTSTRSAPRER